jgi:CMP-2-keto-3-deoxyoctulosonic acid synthetase
MAWPKGKTRPEGAGRKRGTPNKQTKMLMDICEEEGIDPFRAMIKAASRISHPKDQVDAYEKICQYIYPKRKAIEHTANVDPALLEAAESLSQLSEDELRKIVKEEMDE